MSRLKFAVAGLVIITVGLFVAIGPARAQDATPGGPGNDPVNGAQLFAENCAVCHGATGEGRVGATLNKVFVSMNADVELRQIISNGREGTFMPGWVIEQGGPLSENEIGDLIAYIKSWGQTYEPPAPLPQLPPEVIPPVPQVSGDPNNGYLLFQQNCVACHGKQGEGRIGANLTSTFPSIEPGAFAIETIKRGISGTMMPGWSQANGGPLTDAEINDVAAYVLSLQSDPVERPGEVVQQGSALPFIVVGVLAVVVIAALGIALNRRESAGKG